MYIYIDHCVANRFACVTSHWAIVCVGGGAWQLLHLQSLFFGQPNYACVAGGRGRPVTMNFSWYTYANGMQHR